MTNRAYAKSNGDGLLCSILWLGLEKGLGSVFLNIPTAVRTANQTRHTVPLQIATSFRISYS